MADQCTLPNSNQVDGIWEWLQAVGPDGCVQYLTCASLVDCLPPSPESPTWDGTSPGNTVTIADGGATPPLGHQPTFDVNIDAACLGNALVSTGDGLCVPQGANGAVNGPIVGSGTDADPWRLDYCQFGNVPIGTSVTHLGFSNAGCLVRDTIPMLNETAWEGINGNGGIAIVNSAGLGHNPTISIVASPSCANNLLSIQADGLCVQETPLTITSSDTSIDASHSGVSDHTVDLVVNFPDNVPWTGTAQDGSVSVLSGGTDGHGPVIGVNVASLADCPGNLITKTGSGLCAQETPITITSNDSSVGIAFSGTANHTIDLSVPVSVVVPWEGVAQDASVTVTPGGTDGHGPTIGVNVASLADCPGNILAKAASGLCVQQTPLTVTSPNDSITIAQSGTADHTLAIDVDICNLDIPAGSAASFVGVDANGCLVTDSISIPGETVFAATSDASIDVVAAGTNGHTPGLSVVISPTCANNLLALQADGLCVQETPITITSNDSSVGIAFSGTANHTIDLSVAAPVETTWTGAALDASVTINPGGTAGHAPTFGVNIASVADCPGNLLGLAASGLCVQETPITITSNDSSVGIAFSGTANHTIDLSVGAAAQTPLVVTSPNSTINFAQSGTANHTVSLDVDWCAAGSDIPTGVINAGGVLGVDNAGCVVKGPAGFFAQSNGANDFVPLGSNYNVEIDYTGVNGTAINGQPVFNAGTNTLWFPLLADDDYRRIGDAGPTYKSFTESDQAWRTGDVVWGDSTIQANTKGDFRGNLNIGQANNVPSAGQFAITQGETNTASGLYAHASGIGAVASGAVAAFARGVNETAGGGWAGPTQAQGNGGFATGRGAWANGEWSSANGRAVQALGNTTMAFGSFIRLEGNFSGAVGRALFTTPAGDTAFLGGGFDNTVDTTGAAIVGSANGLITGNANFSLLHGNNNTINSGGSSFNSGDNNVIDCFGTSMAQGRDITITNPAGITEASGAFGRNSTLSGEQCYSFGTDLITSGFMCFNQGQNNTVFGNRGVAIGQDNFLNNIDVGAVVGSNNTLNANTVDGYLIGEGNVGDAQNIIGLGKDTNITHAGSVLISATTNAFPVFNSTATEQFAVRAPGGVRLTTNGTSTSGAFLNPGGSFWGAISARETKTDIDKVSGNFGALERIQKLPLYMFRYNEEDSNVRNLGPMAEEWAEVMGDTGLVNKKAAVRTLRSGDHRDTQDKRKHRKEHNEDIRSKAVDAKRERMGGMSQTAEGVSNDARYDTKEITTISPNDLAALALAGMQELISEVAELKAQVKELQGKKKLTK